MKIIDVSEFYSNHGGGVKTYNNQKLSIGSQLGHEIIIIAPGPYNREESRLGGKIIWVKSPVIPFDHRYYLFTNKKAIHNILNRENPDIVEGSSYMMGGWYAGNWQGHAARSLIIHADPVMGYPHTFLSPPLSYNAIHKLFGWYYTRYLRRMNRYYDVTIVSGSWLKNKLAQYKLENLSIIHGGIDKNIFTPSYHPEVKKQWLQKCGIHTDAPLLVTVSRFHPEKRYRTLFKAYKMASQKRTIGWIIFGDGPGKNNIKKQAENIDGVYYAGFTKDRNHFAQTLANADALFHGSAAEIYALSVAEAINCGLPIIAPNYGGAPAYTKPSFSELYPPGDANKCAEAILKLLSRPINTLRQACIEHSHDRIITTKAYFEKLFNLYENLLKRQSK